MTFRSGAVEYVSAAFTFPHSYPNQEQIRFSSLGQVEEILLNCFENVLSKQQILGLSAPSYFAVSLLNWKGTKPYVTRNSYMREHTTIQTARFLVPETLLERQTEESPYPSILKPVADPSRRSVVSKLRHSQMPTEVGFRLMTPEGSSRGRSVRLVRPFVAGQPSRSGDGCSKSFLAELVILEAVAVHKRLLELDKSPHKIPTRPLISPTLRVSGLLQVIESLCNTPLRRLPLYPAELRARSSSLALIRVS
jgi:hypothetical protein